MTGKKKPIIIIEESDESDDDSLPLRGCRSYKDVETQTTLAMKFINYQSPSDPRNINFARLVAYELQFIPDERQSYIPEIFNVIRVLRGAPQLSEIVKNLPKISDPKTDNNLTPDQADDDNEIQCDYDLTQCYDDFTQCDDELTQCDEDLTQCDKEKFQCDKDLTQRADDESLFHKDYILREVKEIQTNEDEIDDTIIYRQYENRISYSIEALPEIDFHNESPPDEGNKDIARIVAFELERLSEEIRSNAYPQILNLITILKGNSNQVVAFVPNISHFKEATDSSYNPEIPLNIAFDGAL